MNRTPIEWTDFSANPLKYRTNDGRVVWACEKLSAGCKNCYASARSSRFTNRRAGDWNAATMATLTPFMDELELRSMLTCRAATQQRCFVGDMTDLFGEWVPDALLVRLFVLFALRPDVTWQLLTKRADRLHRFMNAPSRVEEVAVAIFKRFSTLRDSDVNSRRAVKIWPLPNVWFGVSCEDQQHADERIPLLLDTPAAIRFVSAEPLLGPLEITPYLNGDATGRETHGPAGWQPGPALDWVIVGGESGHQARPCDVAWIDSIVRQCRRSYVRVFVKQLGSRPCSPAPDLTAWPAHVTWRRQSNDPAHLGFALLRDKKGVDPAEWPAALAVRQFPRSAVSA